MTTPPAPYTRAPWARQRILETATRLFRAEGVHRTGVDRLIAEAGTTKSTFYKYFPSKAELVHEFIRAAHFADEDRWEELTKAHDDPAALLTALSELEIELLSGDGFRGCPFLNTAAETPNRQDDIRIMVEEHREWYTAVVAEQFEKLGHTLPGDAADEFMIARDGAMMGALADVPAVTSAFRRAVARLLAEVA